MAISLQRFDRSAHNMLNQSINEHHEADITFAARHQHVSVQKMMTVVIRGFTTGLLQLCQILINSYHRTSMQGYSIHSEKKIQKVSVFPHFTPKKHPKKGRQ